MSSTSNQQSKTETETETQVSKTYSCEVGTVDCPPADKMSSPSNNQQSKMSDSDSEDERVPVPTWAWVSSKFSKDKTTIIKRYPKGTPMKEVHAKTESEYGEYVWDWVVHDDKDEVHVFKNHWRVKEEEGKAKGKTQEQMWEEEAIGKCLRMAKVWKKMKVKCVEPDGTEDESYGVETTKQCWIANRMRGGKLTEEEARAEVEKAFADYLAEYPEEA